MRIEQPPLDEHLCIGRRAVAEQRKSVAIAQSQLMVEQPATFAVEAVDEIRPDEIRERCVATHRRAQIALHREFPVQALPARRIDEEVDFAERLAVAA